jgi:uncharacterized membrane protein
MKATKILTLLALLLMTALAVGLPAMALGQDGGASDNVTPPPTTTTTTLPTTTTTTPPPPPPDSITMSTDFPAIEAIATGTFNFNVALSYDGRTDRVFDLNATAPAGWDVYVTPQYDSQRISSMLIESSFTAATKTVKLTATPQTYPLPDPGNYKLTLQAVAGEVFGSIDLTARITAKYLLTALPYSQLYNTTASAGRDNTYSLVITNTGTATIDNIKFSSEKPDGWEITFQPDKIDLLNTLNQNTVDVNIKPPPKTVAGDYMVTLHISGTQATAGPMDVRVTVETPTIWGWVGVFIIAVVVVGLVAVFMRFGRR